MGVYVMGITRKAKMVEHDGVKIKIFQAKFIGRDSSWEKEQRYIQRKVKAIHKTWEGKRDELVYFTESDIKEGAIVHTNPTGLSYYDCNIFGKTFGEIKVNASGRLVVVKKKMSDYEKEYWEKKEKITHE